MLPDAELYRYACELREEARWLRLALSEALALVQRLTIQVERFRVRIEQLIKALRDLREGLRLGRFV